MYISMRWLARHVDLDGITPEELARDLTLSTAEVEGLERFAPHLSDVVVGHVTHRERHPDADKLNICTVDVGKDDPLQIVCGAPNVDAGQRVAVAQVGCVLPEDFKIKKSKIRGVESRGMICSERELGLGDEHDGIWVLPGEPAIGEPVAEALGIVDWIIEIDNKSLTHRPDLWGHRGIAREVAAIYRRELRPLDSDLGPTGDAAPLPLRVESDACSRYLAVGIEGVTNGRSPDWMRNLLLAVGQRPLTLCVDLSNFVMLDLGQPNHLFDRRRISPEGIVVRDAREGETLETLDGVERKLDPSDMLICSGNAPVALAGIMGGEASSVQDDTTELLLEVASFDAARVRRSSARLGLRTDASARFEKSLDPTLPMETAGHLVNLLRELQPGVRVTASPSDEGTWSDPALTLELRGERVRSLLSPEIDDDEIEDILRRLTFGVQRSGSNFTVDVPSRRSTKDVTIEQDLVEEIGRIHRYGNVPERRLEAELLPPPRDERRRMVRSLEERAAGAARFHEVMSYSFVEDELLGRLGIADQERIEVVNPVAEGVSKIRRSVMPSLIGALPQNLHHRDEVRLFEIGKGYLPELAEEEGGEPVEVHEMGLLWSAPKPKKGASFDAARRMHLQAVVADLVADLGLPPIRWAACGEDEAPPYLHPVRTLVGYLPLSIQAPGKKKKGAPAPVEELAVIWLGDLEPGIARDLEVDADVAVASLLIDGLLEIPRRPPGYNPIPKFPAVKVDVALAVPAECSAGDARGAIEKAGKGLVRSARLFDVYSGEQVGEGRKSLAWSVELQAQDRTLSDKDGAKFLDRLERLCTDLGGELRRS